MGVWRQGAAACAAGVRRREKGEGRREKGEGREKEGLRRRCCCCCPTLFSPLTLSLSPSPLSSHLSLPLSTCPAARLLLFPLRIFLSLSPPSPSLPALLSLRSSRPPTVGVPAYLRCCFARPLDAYLKPPWRFESAQLWQPMRKKYLAVPLIASSNTHPPPPPPPPSRIGRAGPRTFQLARRFHPDKNQGQEAHEKVPSAAAGPRGPALSRAGPGRPVARTRSRLSSPPPQFTDVSCAYKTLKNSSSRAVYDRYA